MNICVITSSFPSHPEDSAQAPFLIPFIGGLRKRGHGVFVFTQDQGGLKKEFLEGTRIKWFPWIGSKKALVKLNPFHPLDSFRILNLIHHGKKTLLPFLRENRVDMCLALWVLPGGFFANYAYRHIGVPYSVWALGSDVYRYGKNPLLYPCMKRVIGEATTVFADGFDLSRKVEERFHRKCFFLATTRTISFSPPNDISGTEMERGPLTAPEGLEKPADQPYRFLFVGRIEKVKGIDILFQSMATLKEEGLNVHLTVVGCGGMEGWAKKFVDQKRLNDQIKLMGNVSDEQLAWLYESSDCVVIPSRSESIPLVFSEALHFNKDLIVTDVGDMGMLGRQFRVAWVIPPGDPVTLKETMKRGVESRGENPFQKTEEKREDLKRLFNIETSVDRFLADYL